MSKALGHGEEEGRGQGPTATLASALQMQLDTSSSPNSIPVLKGAEVAGPAYTPPL